MSKVIGLYRNSDRKAVNVSLDGIWHLEADVINDGSMGEEANHRRDMIDSMSREEVAMFEGVVKF